MANSLLMGITKYLQSVERAFLFSLFGRPFPPPAICLVSAPVNSRNSQVKPFSMEDIWGDGFLFAVPKRRRTVEKKLQRKFGCPKYVWKLLVPKRLIPCNTCGHFREVGVICPNCFKIAMDETKAMQNKIQEDLGLSPNDKEVVVLYNGEQIDQAEEYWKNKRIVEMPKERPPWFTKNLLQKTTRKPSTSTDIEPSELA